MIALSLSLRVDELLYGWVARLGSELNFRFRQDTVRYLFGCDNGRAKVDFPIRLDYLAYRVPETFASGEDALKKGTHFPLYSPFLNEVVRTRISASMREVNGEGARRISCLEPLRIGLPSRLRCCPACWIEDDKNETERYWRRSHQGPGVLVCSRHYGPLSITPVPWRSAGARQEFIPASEVSLRACREVRVMPHEEAVLQDVAAGCAWLLNDNRTTPGPMAFQNAYACAFTERGLMRRGAISSSVTEFVEDHVGKSLLRRFESELPDQASNWVLRVTRPGTASRCAQGPLRHLLLMSALGFRADSFFGIMAEPNPIDKIRQMPPAELKGTPNESKCASRGSDIERWWNEQEVSVSEIARRAGVAPGTVLLFASRIGLTFPRRSETGTTWSKPKIKERDPTQRRERCREALLQHLNNYPGMTQTEMMHRRLFGIRWLAKHDRDWLREHVIRSSCRGGAPELDWKKRDEDFAARLPKILAKLKKTNQGITLTSIGREVGLSLSNATVYRRLPRTLRLVCSMYTSKIREKLQRTVN